MEKMDCEHCESGNYLKAGTHILPSGIRLTTTGTWNCKLKVIREMACIDNVMYCSEFKEAKR